jgi:hypothetical protein
MGCFSLGTSFIRFNQQWKNVGLKVKTIKNFGGKRINGNNRNGEGGNKGSEKDLGEDRCTRKDAKVDKIYFLFFIFSHQRKMGALKRMVKDVEDVGGFLNCPNTYLETSSFLATLLFCE